MSRAVAGTVIAVVAAIVAAGCAREASDPRADASAPPLLGHVHGMGTDPADGRLYVATHSGLYRESSGGLEKVGTGAGADRDLMGFLVAGPGAFLASGHPSPEDVAAPNPLGLVRSSDGGATWQTVSLGGDVDFHALDQGSGVLYGVDADGVLRTSTDTLRWEVAPSPPALDVAADPAGEGRVVLAVEGGVAIAAREGIPGSGPSRFQFQPGPQLLFLSWAPDGELGGLAPDGRVYRSLDAGSTWAPSGTVPGGRPQALTALGRGRVLAATSEGIFESRDAGRTFTTIVAGTS